MAPFTEEKDRSFEFLNEYLDKVTHENDIELERIFLDSQRRIKS